MPRVNLPASQPVYDAAQAFVDAALRRDGSLFTPGEAIWTAGTIEELHRRLNPTSFSSGMPGESFKELLRRLLTGAAPAVIQLAAEVLYVHLLPLSPKSVTGQTKRRLINAVLSWSAKAVSIPPERDSALQQGLVEMDEAFLNRRPELIRFLLDFARVWKALSGTERERLLADPWAFSAMVRDLPGGKPNLPSNGAAPQAEILLHLVHPNTFEPVIVLLEKAWIADTLRAYVTTPSDDIDRNLAQIRARVDQIYGPGRSLLTIPAPAGPLPRSLGEQLAPYVKLVAMLDGSAYTPAQLVERLGRISPPLVRLPGAPVPELLARDLTYLRLLMPVEGGAYRRWAHLDDRTEGHLLRYAALTLVVPREDGGYDLPALTAPFDGQPHAVDDWPCGEPLLRWYEEAGLVARNDDRMWQSLPGALDPIDASTPTAQALATFLGYLHEARASRGEPPPLEDDVLQVIAPDQLEERIAAIQRELMVDRTTILRIYRALIAGQHVILSGPPGTGKTHLATLLPQVLWRDATPIVQRVPSADPLRSPAGPPEQRTLKTIYRDGYAVDVVTATEDWGVRHVIGGIVPQIQRNGDEQTLVFTIRHGHLTRAVLSNYAGYNGAHVPPAGSLVRQEVREGERRYRGRWLVIDEFTRAPIDAAFGSLLTTLGGQGSPLMVPTEDIEVPVPLPRDFRLIGTLNSFDRHFLNQISEAMKRRFTFIDILPPGPEYAEAEQALVVRRALLQLSKSRVLDVIEDPSGGVVWEDVLSVALQTAEGEAPRYTLHYDEPEARQAVEDFWRVFSAIRRYRQLGTAQAQAVYGSLFSGYGIGMAWAEALDTALADVLADQLQVINRDEQRVLLAYLQHSGNGQHFAAAVRETLEKRVSSQRQQAHLALLGLASTEEVTAERLVAHFALGTPLIIAGQGLFARRLDAFINERGL